MKISILRQAIPGPATGKCPTCSRRLPAYGGQCLCGYVIPQGGQEDVGLPDVQASPLGFRLAHISDLHIGSIAPDGLTAQDRLWMILEAAKQVEVDHLLISGDVSKVGKLEEMRACEETLTAGGYPASKRTVIPGNHDLQASMDLSIYQSIFPTPLPSIDELAPGLWVASLDSNAVALKDRSPLFARLVAPVQGRVGSRSLGILRRDLANKPGVKLLMLHHHLTRHPPEELNSRWDLYWGTRVGRKVLLDPVHDDTAVLQAARELGVSAIFHGHKHWYGQTGYRVGGLPVFNAGSTTLMPQPTFRVFDFKDGAWVAIHEIAMTL